MKTCTKCKQVKELLHFGISKRDGILSQCKKCKNLHNRLKYKDYYKKNKDKLILKGAVWSKNNPEKIKRYRDKRKLKNIEYSKKYRLLNKDKLNSIRNIRVKNKKKIDPIFKMKCNLRSRFSEIISNKKLHKRSNFYSYIGCNMDILIEHIESKFSEGMSWNNYGEWHIDHIIPLAIANTEEKVIQLFHYTNLQPLWAKENLSKGKKYG